MGSEIHLSSSSSSGLLGTVGYRDVHAFTAQNSELYTGVGALRPEGDLSA